MNIIYIKKRRKPSIPWTPSDLTTEPVYWYDAAAITNLSNNDQLNTWTNLGSGSNAGRDSSTSEPGYPRYRTNQLNGLPGIEWPTFNSNYGTRMWCGNTLTGGNSQDVTMFTVAKCLNTSGTRQIMVRTAHYEISSGRTASRWACSFWNGGFTTQSTTSNYSTSQAYLITGIWDKGNTKRILRQNGTQQNQTNQVTWTYNYNFSTLIGSNQFNSPNLGQTFVGFMYEIILLNQTYSNDNMLRTEGYLAHKWGLTSSLPAGHPYKTNPPYQ